MTRYKGTITDLKGPNRLSGFIRLNTITHADGRPVSLETKKDIFIHDVDLDGTTIAEGLEVIFKITPDTKQRGLRADGATLASECTIEAGVEIHFDEQVIDHPSVPIRWCIKPDTVKRIEAAPDRQWALMLIAKTRPDSDGDYASPCRYVFKSVVGVEAIAFNKAYFTFPAPGEYDFAAYLISSEVNSHRLQHLYGEIETYYKRHPVWDIDSDEINLEVRKYADDPVTIEATARELVSVPEGIFATPLPQWQRTWFGYFRLARPDDECSTRGRSIFAFTLGIPIFLLWEGFKRSYMLLLGFIHLILGGSPLPVWKVAITRQLSAIISGPRGEYEFEPLTSYRGWRKLRHPLVLLGLAGLTGLYLAFPGGREAFLTVIFAVTTFFGVISLALFALNQRFKYLEKTREERKQEEVARQMTLIRTYAMCGVDEPLKKAPTSIKLVWTGVKRRVCRTYA